MAGKKVTEKKTAAPTPPTETATTENKNILCLRTFLWVFGGAFLVCTVIAFIFIGIVYCVKTGNEIYFGIICATVILLCGIMCKTAVSVLQIIATVKDKSDIERIINEIKGLK
jgi:hypothetical protein